MFLSSRKHCPGRHNPSKDHKFSFEFGCWVEEVDGSEALITFRIDDRSYQLSLDREEARQFETYFSKVLSDKKGEKT